MDHRFEGVIIWHSQGLSGEKGRPKQYQKSTLFKRRSRHLKEASHHRRSGRESSVSNGRNGRLEILDDIKIENEKSIFDDEKGGAAWYESISVQKNLLSDKTAESLKINKDSALTSWDEKCRLRKTYSESRLAQLRRTFQEKENRGSVSNIPRSEERWNLHQTYQKSEAMIKDEKVLQSTIDKELSQLKLKFSSGSVKTLVPKKEYDFKQANADDVYESLPHDVKDMISLLNLRLCLDSIHTRPVQEAALNLPLSTDGLQSGVKASGVVKPSGKSKKKKKKRN